MLFDLFIGLVIDRSNRSIDRSIDLFDRSNRSIDRSNDQRSKTNPTYKGTTPVDGGNFEKVLDILVEHPQLVKNLKELADELRTFYSKLTCKIQYFMRLGDIDFMFILKGHRHS